MSSVRTSLPQQGDCIALVSTGWSLRTTRFRAHVESNLPLGAASCPWWGGILEMQLPFLPQVDANSGLGRIGSASVHDRK